ncbi:hypothetical protein [Aquimarina sp. 2201CG14-23]|uniref:hypothetical protein n=1 Tax=Aquimarina mycalae TaxID=3040073 RepID=UPI002477E8BC|nr:hypothetical protein [Aquimarina sp. 2201CG14-23]MDH7444798.1 hypothetical protein [Aquimarina sp. 2201CG14-23]
MINAGKEFRKGFFKLLDTFGGQIIIHKDFNCDNSSSYEVKGMKNHKKEDSSVVMFQFPEKIDVQVGDILQQKNSSEFWKIYKIEEKIVTNIFVCFILYVNKIDSNSKPA